MIDPVERAALLEQIQPDGEVLQALREAAGFTLEQFAERCGLEPHQLAGVERGTRRLTPSQVERLAEAARLLVPADEPSDE